jgi:hypothetical protein
MNEAQIKEAKREAVRFIKAVDAWHKRFSQEDFDLYASKEGGSLRRASMDLTLALAQMRKP